MKNIFKKIGLLGGSFNPPHLGHVAICRYCLEKEKLGEVWILPCFQHPFGKPLVPFEHRFKMCELAFEEFEGRVKILDIEKSLGDKSYTLRTVLHLKKQFPDREFILILGEDAAKEAPTWRDFEMLKKEVDWLVVPRSKGSPIPNVSATEIRKALRQKTDLEKSLSLSIIHYIAKENLY